MSTSRKSLLVPSFALLVLILLAIACGSSSTPASSATSAQPVNTSAPAPTQKPTAPPAPTNTPKPTNTPAPTPTDVPKFVEPTTIAQLEGVGKQVTDNVEMPFCLKAVFYWETTPNKSGLASLILKLHNAADGREMSIANEFKTNVSDALNGSALQPLKGGQYFFSTENTDEKWSVRVECQDNQAPAANTIHITGSGNQVTANYELPKCIKSIFSWSVEPNSSGLASIILYVHQDGSQDFHKNLANEFSSDLSAPLTGQSVQSISAGIYYLTVENTNGPWAIDWECKDAGASQPATVAPAASQGGDFQKWASSQVIEAFKAAGLEVESASPMTKADYGMAPMTAAEGTHFVIPSLCADCGARVLNFASESDLEKMQTYYTELGKSSAAFFSWVFVKDNILVQINGDLSEEKARQYEAALNGLK